MGEIWLRKYKGDTAIVMVYKIKVFDSIDWKFTSPVSPMPLPEESGEENILVKMEGNTHTCRLSWLVKEETINQGVTKTVSGTPVGGHTTASTKTIFEILKWFSRKNGFIGRSMDEKFDILIWDNFNRGSSGTLPQHDMSTGGVEAGSLIDFIVDPILPANPASPNPNDWVGLPYQMVGFIRDFNFRTDKGEPATLRATIEFIEGDAVGSYQSLTPDAIHNYRLENHASTPTTHITIKFDQPRHSGKTSVSSYDVGYRVEGSPNDFTWENTGSTATTIHLGDLYNGGTPTAQTWEITVAAVNTQGRGKVHESLFLATTAP